MPGCTSSVLGAGLAIDVGVEHFWCSNVLGNVVHVQLVKQDWAKVDLGNLTGIVVNINYVIGVCHIAVKNGGMFIINSQWFWDLVTIVMHS